MLKIKKHTAHKISSKKNIYASICGFSCIMLVLSLVVRLYFSGALATKNVQLREVLDQKSQLEKEIITLRYEESKLESLSYIEENATRLGFVAMQGSLTPLDISGASLAAVTNQ